MWNNKRTTESLNSKSERSSRQRQCVEVIAEDLVEEVEVIQTIVDEIQTKE